MLPEWLKGEGSSPSIILQEFEGKEFSDALHDHESFELCFIWRGTGTWQIGGRKGRFQPGSMLLCPPRVLHAWRSDLISSGGEKVSFIVLRFAKSVLSEQMFKLPEMRSLSILRKEMEEALDFVVTDRDRLRSRLRSIDRAQGVLRLARFLVALDLVAQFKRSQVSDGKEDKRRVSARDLARVELVKRLVEERFRGTISREQAAAEVSLDEASFSRFFRKAMGTSFVDYVANYRVRHAAALLGSRRDISLQEVAERSGFGSVSSFHRQFRKRLGTTPNSYRKAANSELLGP